MKNFSLLALLFMTDIPPPFDPPYITHHENDGKKYCVKTFADGRTEPIEISDAVPLSGKSYPGTKANLAKSSTAKNNKQSYVEATRRHSDQQAALYLNVPFAEKDKAKNLGAKWDASRKKWYVPRGLDLSGFSCWWPEDMK